jgi:hypothetical protein
MVHSNDSKIAILFVLMTMGLLSLTQPFYLLSLSVGLLATAHFTAKNALCFKAAIMYGLTTSDGCAIWLARTLIMSVFAQVLVSALFFLR